MTTIESYAIRRGHIKPEPARYHESKTGRRWGAQIAYVRDLIKRRKTVSSRTLPMIPNASKMLGWMFQHGELRLVGHHKPKGATGVATRVFAINN